MDFDDFIKKKYKYYSKNKKQKYQYNGSYNHHDHHKYSKLRLFGLLKNLKNNRKLKWIVLGLFAVGILVTIGLIVWVYPYLVKLFQFISQNGISGVVDEIIAFMERLWKGA
jgi:hypothetical protein